MDEAFHTSAQVVPTIRSFLTRWMRRAKIRQNDWTFVGPTAGRGVLTRCYLDGALLFDRHACVQCGVRQSEYEELDVGSLGDNIIVFENPPFGQHSAVKFFNCMARFPQVKYMALVFPDRFRGDQTSANGKSALDEYFHCTSHLPLPFGSFEDAGGVTVQIQCSFQIWERSDKKRFHPDVGFDVGGRDCTGNNVYWVKRFNPNKYKGRAHCVTTSKPHARHLPIPIRVRRRVRHPKDVILRVLQNIWKDYPHHSRLSFHAGNLQNAFNREFGKKK